MKASKHTLIYLATAVALTTSFQACSLLESVQKTVIRGSQGSASYAEDKQTAEPAAATHTGPVLNPPKQSAKKSSTKKSGKSKAVKKGKKKSSTDTSVSKKDLEAAKKISRDKKIAKPVDVATEGNAQAMKKSNEAHSATDNISVAGEWVIYSVRENRLTGEERPYVVFDTTARRFYGSNGCNYINGDLTLAAPGRIAIDNMITTQRLCDDVQYEHLINLALSEAKAYTAYKSGQETFLALTDGRSAQPLIVLRRHNQNYLNAAWRIVTLNGTPMDETASITIDVTDMKVHVNTNCNIYNGSIFIDPDKSSSLQFLDIVGSHSSCPANKRETELLLALEEAESVQQLPDGVVAIYNTDGNEIMTLEKLNLPTD